MRSYCWIKEYASLFRKSLRWFAMRSCCRCNWTTALRRFLPPLVRRATRRCSTRSLRCWHLYQCCGSTRAPSEVVIKLATPTSTPTSRPVGGSGCGVYSTLKQAYQPLAFLISLSVLIVPSNGRCQRTAIRPMPDTRKRRPSILKPLPYSLKPKLSKRLRPRKRGYPALSPDFTRRKNAWNALSRSATTTCKTWLCTSAAHGFDALWSLTRRNCSYLPMVSVRSSYAVFRSSSRSLYQRRHVSRVASNFRACALDG